MIDQIQNDVYEIPMDYISRLEIHTRTHLAQIARYTKLDSDTTALDGKGGKNVLACLADKMDFALDMILTVYKLGKELGSTNMNLKTRTLIGQCESFRQRFFEDRSNNPRDLDVHIMNLSRKIRKLFNGDEQDHDSDVPTS